MPIGVPMPRKLKTYVMTSGFFDLAVAAPSMKAALQLWGSRNNPFQLGFAKETNDPAIVRATLEHPGVVLRRPLGSKVAFSEHSSLPKLSALGKAAPRRPSAPPRGKKPVARKAPSKADKAATRKAAELYDLAQKRRELQAERERATEQKARARQAAAVKKAETALARARERHEARVSQIEAERAAIDRKAQAERVRWEAEKAELEASLRRARE